MFPRLAKNQRVDFTQKEDWIGEENDLYMERKQYFAFRFRSKIYQLRKHIIYRADLDSNPHTHPFSFWSFRAKNGYLEWVYDEHGVFKKSYWRAPFSLSFCQKDTAHNILRLGYNKPVTTFVLAIVDEKDPKLSKWGFIENGELIDSSEYLAKQVKTTVKRKRKNAKQRTT